MTYPARIALSTLRLIAIATVPLVVVGPWFVVVDGARRMNRRMK